MYSTRTSCRLCGGTLTEVFKVGDRVALSGKFPAPGEPVETGPLTVVMCDECGLSQLAETYNLSSMYGPGYGYQSGLNPSMVKHLNELAELAVRCHPQATSILDIGSNDGTLLRSPCLKGLHKTGTDPIATQYAENYPLDAWVVGDFFRKENFDKVDIVTSVAMFYDLEDPLQFAQDVADTLNPGGVWLLEVGDLEDILKNTAFDTFCHEHLEYYRVCDVVYIANQVGLTAECIFKNTVNGGSFVAVMRKGAFGPIILGEGQKTRLLWQGFPQQVALAKERTLEFLAKSPNPIGLGASTKGNILLQHFGITPKELPFIAEINKDKWGKVTPGTSIPIISEQEAGELHPSHWFVLPWHFRDHMKQKYGSLPMYFPLPLVHQLC